MGRRVLWVLGCLLLTLGVCLESGRCGNPELDRMGPALSETVVREFISCHIIWGKRQKQERFFHRQAWCRQRSLLVPNREDKLWARETNPRISNALDCSIRMVHDFLLRLFFDKAPGSIPFGVSCAHKLSPTLFQLLRDPRQATLKILLGLEIMGQQESELYRALTGSTIRPTALSEESQEVVDAILKSLLLKSACDVLTKGVRKQQALKEKMTHLEGKKELAGQVRALKALRRQLKLRMGKKRSICCEVIARMFRRQSNAGAPPASRWAFNPAAYGALSDAEKEFSEKSFRELLGSIGDVRQAP